MKGFLIFSICILSTVVMGTNLPKGAYLWQDFEAAKKDAVKNKKPILFVFTDLKTK